MGRAWGSADSWAASLRLEILTGVGDRVRVIQKLQRGIMGFLIET